MVSVEKTESCKTCGDDGLQRLVTNNPNLQACPDCKRMGTKSNFRLESIGLTKKDIECSVCHKTDGVRFRVPTVLKPQALECWCARCAVNFEVTAKISGV